MGYHIVTPIMLAGPSTLGSTDASSRRTALLDMVLYLSTFPTSTLQHSQPHNQHYNSSNNGREQQDIQDRQRNDGHRARHLRVRQQVPRWRRLAGQREAKVAARRGGRIVDDQERLDGPLPRHRGRGQERPVRRRDVQALPMGDLAGRGRLVDLQDVRPEHALQRGSIRRGLGAGDACHRLGDVAPWPEPDLAVRARGRCSSHLSRRSWRHPG